MIGRAARRPNSPNGSGESAIDAIELDPALRPFYASQRDIDEQDFFSHDEFEAPSEEEQLAYINQVGEEATSGGRFPCAALPALLSRCPHRAARASRIAALLAMIGVLAVAVGPDVAASGAARGARTHWVIRDLGVLSGLPCAFVGPIAITNRGQIVGLNDNVAFGHVVVWERGRVIDLGKAGFAGESAGVQVEPCSEMGGTERALAMNARGAVVWTDREGDAWLWQHGRMTDLGTLSGKPSFYSEANAINNLGQIVGSSESEFLTPTGPVPHGFLWQHGRMTDLGTLSGKPSASSAANAINNLGQIVGTSETAHDVYHAFLWEKGRMTDLGTLSGKPSVDSEAFAINDRGQVLGNSWESRFAPRQFLWQNGRMTALGPPAGERPGYWSAINRRGQVIGFCVAANDASRPCLWQNGTPIDLGTLRGDRGRAIGINSRGQIVGRVNVRPWSGESVAFVWQNGVMTQLPSLPTNNDHTTIWLRGSSEHRTPCPPFVCSWMTGSTAIAINDRGVIVGVSQNHAVEWIPSPAR
jgi:probable HAF family extracellular repeat protein